ncbi:hypothetical protein DTO212C5_1881 [Paecilomyces variotii]|nr:hypothetical protein DTO212C5_1881 [Paecilomyces variotii]
MVQTRAQERSAGQGSKSSQTEMKPRTTNRSKTTSKKEVEEPDVREEQKDDEPADETKTEKRKRDNAEKEEEREQEQKSDKEQQPNGVEREEPPNKAPKTSESEKDDEPINSIDESAAAKVHKVIEEFGALPLKDAGVAEPLQATPETVLAMVLDAMLKSTRISHSLAQKAVNTVIEAGYHDIKKLSQTTWDDRVDVLAKGGYNRYREQASTNLGALIEFVNGKYDGDLNNLYRKADHQPRKVRELIKEIKGLGDLGTDIFFNNAQSIWRTLAPFIDARSLRTADDIGIGTDVDAIYKELKFDPVQMSKLANGLSAVRLEKKQGEVSEEE